MDALGMFYHVPNPASGGKLPESERRQWWGTRGSPWEWRALVRFLILTHGMTFPTAFCEPRYLYLPIGIISIFPTFTEGFQVSRDTWRRFSSCVPFPQYGMYRELTKIHTAVTGEHVQVCVWRTKLGWTLINVQLSHKTSNERLCSPVETS